MFTTAEWKFQYWQTKMAIGVVHRLHVPHKRDFSVRTFARAPPFPACAAAKHELTALYIGSHLMLNKKLNCIEFCFCSAGWYELNFESKPLL